jgi:hypothetical protein
MAVYNLKEYSAVQEKRIRILSNGKRKGPITAAKYMVAQLRSMAPKDSGRLRGSIRRIGSLVRVSGSNPRNSYPYVHWINETPELTKGGVLTSWGKRYSQIPSGNRTGTPKFHQIALERSHKVFRDSMISVTDKVLSAEF